MHIAQFTNTYHPIINGVVRSVSVYRQALMEAGHQVFVFAQQNNGYEDEEAFIYRYPSFQLPVAGDIPAAIPVSPFIDRLLPSLKLDVIHTHHPVLLGQAAANKAQELNLPLVFTFHTQYQEYTHYVPFPQEAIQDFLKNAIQGWVQKFMRQCHHIVIPSESMRATLIDEYGLEGPMTIIPTGIDLTPYQNADRQALRAAHGWQNERVMISVGRLAIEKNWALLLEATALALQNQPDLRLVLLGDGSERPALESLAAELGIQERVDFMGAIPFEDVPGYLQAADLFGFASTSETQGLVTLEALAAHLPVVAVDASGTRDIVQHERQGFLTDENAPALAQAIGQVLGDPACLENFRAAAQKRAEDFEIQRLMKKLLNVYQESIADQQAGRLVQVNSPSEEDEKVFAVS
ncbi:MAG: glycosyltransferase [Anaerolineales bacterium]|jgi:glycosyltransferase involved in cell wall biosynthesis|nr:glycosyltransferase [Anaerolineales bacterium]